MLLLGALGLLDAHALPCQRRSSNTFPSPVASQGWAGWVKTGKLRPKSHKITRSNSGIVFRNACQKEIIRTEIKERSKSKYLFFPNKPEAQVADGVQEIFMQQTHVPRTHPPPSRLPDSLMDKSSPLA